MKRAPTFTKAQMAYLRALLTPECCHPRVGEVACAENHLCERQKAKTYDRAMKFLGWSLPAKPAEDCTICQPRRRKRT